MNTATNTRDALTKKQAKKFIGKRGKRVAIAKDVLKQLKAKKFHADGTYFELEDRDFNFWGERHLWSASTLQSEMKKLKTCKVCAIGAALTSGIMLYGEVEGDEFDPTSGFNSNAAKSFFTQKELAAMEAIFETRSHQQLLSIDFYQKIKWEEGLRRKVREHTTYDQRMKCIFKSIASNNGRVSQADIFKRIKRLLKKKTV